MKVRQTITGMLFSMGFVASLFLFLFIGWPTIEAKAISEEVKLEGGGIGMSRGNRKAKNTIVYGPIICWGLPPMNPDSTKQLSKDKSWGLPEGKIDRSKDKPMQLVPVAYCPQQYSTPESWTSSEIAQYEKENDFGEEPKSVKEAQPAFQNLREVWKSFKYPPKLLEAELTGKTIFRVKIDLDGSYTEHIVVKEVHPLLTEELEKHLPSLYCKPCWAGRSTEPRWITLPFIIDPKR